MSLWQVEIYDCAPTMQKRTLFSISTSSLSHTPPNGSFSTFPALTDRLVLTSSQRKSSGYFQGQAVVDGGSEAAFGLCLGTFHDVLVNYCGRKNCLKLKT